MSHKSTLNLQILQVCVSLFFSGFDFSRFFFHNQSWCKHTDFFCNSLRAAWQTFHHELHCFHIQFCHVETTKSRWTTVVALLLFRQCVPWSRQLPEKMLAKYASARPQISQHCTFLYIATLCFFGLIFQFHSSQCGACVLISFGIKKQIQVANFT